MNPGDVTFDFRLPEFGMLLLALASIYGITWFKSYGERRLNARRTAAAAGASEGNEFDPLGPDEPSTEGPSGASVDDRPDDP